MNRRAFLQFLAAAPLAAALPATEAPALAEATYALATPGVISVPIVWNPPLPAPRFLEAVARFSMGGKRYEARMVETLYQDDGSVTITLSDLREIETGRRDFTLPVTPNGGDLIVELDAGEGL